MLYGCTDHNHNDEDDGIANWLWELTTYNNNNNNNHHNKDEIINLKQFNDKFNNNNNDNNKMPTKLFAGLSFNVQLQ